MQIQYDFKSDVDNWCIDNICRFGRVANNDKKTLKKLIQLFNIIRHEIPATPRNINISKEFQCPNELLEGYHLLLDEIRNGIDIMPRASRKQRNNNHKDELLLDWGVHHLHLGENKIETGKNKGMIKGGKYIAFILFDKNQAYVIGIYDHKSWTDENILKIITKNWPHILAPYKIPRNFDGTTIAIDRKLMRSHRINVPIMINSELYFSPGGGFSMSGFCSDDSEKASKTLRSLDKIDKWILKNSEIIIDVLQEYTDNSTEVVNLELNVGRLVFDEAVSLSTKNGSINIHFPSTSTPWVLIDPIWAETLAPDINIIKSILNENFDGITIEYIPIDVPIMC